VHVPTRTSILLGAAAIVLLEGCAARAAGGSGAGPVAADAPPDGPLPGGAGTGAGAARGRERDDGPRVVAGESFTCTRRGDGTVACCGQGWEGELGNGAFEDEGHLIEVRGLRDATTLAAGGFHACAIRRGGSVWCWGENSAGQAGSRDPRHVGAPQRVEGLDGVATQLSLGVLHSCARMEDGTAWCWGANTKGELGNGATSTSSGPVRVAGLDHVDEIAAGGFASCARLADGTVRCWGANESGQLGDGTTEARMAPTEVKGLAQAAEVGMGSSHVCARRADGTVACWGGWKAGGAATVAGIAGAVQLVTYGDRSCARLEGGEVECWYAGDPPRRGLTGGGDRRWRSVAVGEGHLCGLDAKGALRCEGSGAHGQLCDGSSPPRSSTFPPPY